MSWVNWGYVLQWCWIYTSCLPYLKWSIPWYITKPITRIKASSLAFLTFICWIISAADLPCLLDASADIFDNRKYNRRWKHYMTSTHFKFNKKLSHIHSFAILKFPLLWYSVDLLTVLYDLMKEVAIYWCFAKWLYNSMFDFWAISANVR